MVEINQNKWRNKLSWTLIHKMEVSKNINQSSQCLWLETFKRSGRDVTDLDELHKERHQPRFRLAWNWPHNLCNSTSWPLYFMNEYRETMQYLMVNVLNVSTTQKVAMFHKWYKTTVCNSRDQSKQMKKQIKLNFNTQDGSFKKHQSVQSMSVTWNIQEIR